MKNNLNQNFDNSDLLNNDELDLKLIFKFFFRNKLFIGTLSLVFFIIACFISLRIKKTWEGEFQIVINNKSNSTTMNMNPLLQRFTDIGPQKNNLMTEVEILSSPSVLMSTFFAILAVPALPGKHTILSDNRDSNIFLHKACSLPPLPINPIFMIKYIV